MNSVLHSDRVQRVLAELRALGASEDERYRERVRAREAELGAPVYGRERAALGAGAPLAVSDEVGQVLHALVLAREPDLVVEFGTSLGISTIYLAAALADLGEGRLITSELLPAKAQRAADALAAAGLDGRVEIRAGDAVATLATLPGPVDVLFLDGSNDLYLPLLEALRPQLAPRALVLADMSPGDVHHERYRAHVTDPASGLISCELALDAGLAVSVVG